MEKLNNNKKDEAKFIECNNFKCFKNSKRKLNCLNCQEGKVFVICFNCGKRHYIGRKHYIESEIMRIDCSCGVSFIPCYETNLFIGVKNDK